MPCPGALCRLLCFAKSNPREPPCSPRCLLRQACGVHCGVGVTSGTLHPHCPLGAPVPVLPSHSRSHCPSSLPAAPRGLFHVFLKSLSFFFSCFPVSVCVCAQCVFTVTKAHFQTPTPVVTDTLRVPTAGLAFSHQVSSPWEEGDLTRQLLLVFLMRPSPGCHGLSSPRCPVGAFQGRRADVNRTQPQPGSPKSGLVFARPSVM